MFSPSCKWIWVGLLLGLAPQSASAEEGAPAATPVPRALRELFRDVPKTDLHLHLGGATPLALERKFCRADGMSEADFVALRSQVKSRYADLGDFLGVYRKLINEHLLGPQRFREAAAAVVRQAAQENVRYLELRERVDGHTGGKPEEIASAIEAGLRDGVAWVKQHKNYEMGTGLIICAVRSSAPEQTLQTAKLTVDLARRPNSLVRGFDLAGGETLSAVDDHAAAIRYIKTHGRNLGLKVTLHAGETPTSGKLTGAESMQHALALGADRLGHGLYLLKDRQLAREVRRRGVHLELNASSNVATCQVPGWKDYPLQAYLKTGVKASLSTDDPALFKTNLTQQLIELYGHGQLKTWTEVKALTFNGIAAGFAPAAERRALLRQARAEFRRLEHDPQARTVIDAYLGGTTQRMPRISPRSGRSLLRAKAHVRIAAEFRPRGL